MTDTTTWWQQEHYLAGRPLESDFWLVVMPMIYTYRVALCEPPPGMVHEFYCYRSLHRAMLCFDTWDGGKENPVRDWTRHHAR